jgi:hypothetical protein
MMLHRKKIARRLLIVGAVLVGSLFELRPANAIIGRPLTPLSYAGVARRTTRRAVAYGAVAAPMYAPPPVYW